MSTAVQDMADQEKSKANATEDSVPSTSQAGSTSQDEESGPAFAGMYRRAQTHVEVELEDYFKGPRDIYKHSKWPYFLRLHGSVLPKMIIPLLFIGLWATAIQLIYTFVYDIGIESVLLTVLGFVVGLALSFRSSTAYERYAEGRRYWAQLLWTSRNIARLIWVHAIERHAESADLGKTDVLSKLAALNLLNAFAVSLKHHLRFEPSTEYPDLAPLISNIHTLAGDADQAALREQKASSWKTVGQSLGVPFAESNPRKLLKKSRENLGNTPLEVLTYLSAYVESLFQNKQLNFPIHQTTAINQLVALTDVLTGVERVVNTPLPIAYSISIAQITWEYVMVLPFQLVRLLNWVTIPGTMVAAYIILGLAQIGRELENPFGQDVNDLPLDAYCQELANDIDALTSEPAPLNNDDWMKNGGAKVMWPLSNMEYKGWEARSLEEIRAALKAKANSKDVKTQRKETMIMSEAMVEDARGGDE